MGLFDQCAGNDCAVLQHILQIHQIAVVHMLGVVVRIVEVDNTRVVGIHNILGEQDPAGNILGNLTCHVVPLDCINGGVLVGVFLLDFLVVALDQAQDPVVGGVGLTEQAPGVAVGDVGLGDLKSTVRHDSLFYQILDLFHRGTATHFLTADLHALGDPLDLQGRHTHIFFHSFVCLG